MTRFSLVLACLLSLSSCGGGSGNPFDSPETFFSTMTALELEVVYEPGAEPFTGTHTSGKKFWDLTKDNLVAVFEGRPQAVSVTVPYELSEMTAIAAQSQTTWTQDEMLALAAAHRKTASTATKGTFFVAFVNGHLDENGQANTSVIGVSLTGTTIVFLFKDVIEASGFNPSGPVPKFVEQSTIIHEIGHALGLVNSGVPLTSEHHDAAHGAHCSNTDCVMHYLNEGAAELGNFVQDYLVSGDTVMFGDECLADTRAYTPSGRR